AETITSANARLVDFQATLPLAQIWGLFHFRIRGSACGCSRRPITDGRPESTVTRWREAEFNVIANVEITPFAA
ncbi:hypothetical protein RZO85_26960, partial [Raoultella ornithinolytica]|uniref:hypothetical protein n=1 Tax=Raoultella ornithinolytica TaxID=54291 RepID=UPI00292C0221